MLTKEELKEILETLFTSKCPEEYGTIEYSDWHVRYAHLMQRVKKELEKCDA